MKPVVITPMITPFGTDGKIDFDMTGHLLKRLSGFGVDGVFPLGSTGVFPWIGFEEKKSLLGYIAEYSGSMEVYAGSASPNVEECIELARMALDFDCDYAIILPPYYIAPSVEGMGSFFSRILGSVDIKFMLYNIPQNTGSTIPVDLIEALKREHSNLVGIKDSSGDMRYHERLLRFKSKDFSVLQGQDDLFMQSVLLGSNGGICGTTNLVPQVTRIAQLVENGDIAEATRIQLEEVNPLMDALNSAKFPSGYYYGFYRSSGFNGGYRLPMVEPNPDTARRIDAVLSEMGQE